MNENIWLSPVGFACNDTACKLGAELCDYLGLEQISLVELLDNGLWRVYLKVALTEEQAIAADAFANGFFEGFIVEVKDE